MKKITFLVWLSLVLLPALGFSHSGGTDANGGHYNRRTGEYHYHNGGRASSSRVNSYESTNDRKSQIVYITKTGHKYHRDGCRHLKSRMPMLLKEAKRNYAPCKVCSPPV